MLPIMPYTRGFPPKGEAFLCFKYVKGLRDLIGWSIWKVMENLSDLAFLAPDED